MFHVTFMAVDGPFGTATWDVLWVAVDGPFGTATEDIFWYEVDVFVAAGIGVTPFASILKHIRYQCMNPDGDMKLRKVYFYWVCPDTNSFEWMQELLQEFDTQMAEQGNTNFLTYNIYLTRGWDKDQAQNIILHEGDEADPVTGLQQKTHYGRPNWDKIFENISKDHAGISVGVFFCGPSGLSNTLHQMSNKHSAVDKTGAKFFYNKENF
ncbi:NOX2 [Mytilus coruscus]|uniref:NOX2 n=1 Tax=Mytilus coruscus TaxID=42192 RepID=A0A6J8EY01_MYTCO|nr:NOX2 [Mytilus coruscus]